MFSHVVYSTETTTTENSTDSTTDTTSTDNEEKGSKISLGHSSGSVGETNKKADKHMLWSTMSLLAVGIFSGTALATCTSSSSKLFMIGGAFYLAQELFNWGNYDEGSKRSLDFYLSKNKDDGQRDSIAEALNQTRKAREATEDKQDAIRLSETIYGIAAGIAIAEYFDVHKFGIDPECGKATTSYNPSIPFFDYGQYALGKNIFEIVEKERLNQNEVQNMTLTEYDYHKKIEENYKLAIGHDLSSMLSIISEAHASMEDKFGEMLGAGIGLLGGYLLAEKYKWTLLQHPLRRAVTFGGSALLAELTAGSLDGVISEYQKREKDYQDLLDLYDNTTDSLKLNNLTPDSNTLKIQRSKAPKLTLKTSINIDPSRAPSECLHGSVSNFDIQSCKTSNPVNPTPPKFNITGVDIPTDFQNAATTANELVNATLKGDIAGLNAKGSNLLAMRDIIDEFKKEGEDKVNKDKILKGLDPIDFRQGEQDFIKELENDVKSAYNRMNPSQQAQMQALATRGFPVNVEKTDKKSAIDTAEVSPEISKGMDPKSEKKKFNFDFKDGKKKISDFTSKNVDSAQAFKGYKLNKAEVNKSANEDIFKIITFRYFKSAYPVFFNENKSKK